MGSSKRPQRIGKGQAQLRSRTTRSKGKLLSDPAHNTQLLTDQLRSLGLYAAPTLGDGNCLFRALSDQLYGTPSRHQQLRIDICDWIEVHKLRYEPFVEDERGLDVHLRCMRENATYGGHLELSAFAHLTRRDVKVIQPGLVYVIEWAAGSNLSPDQATNKELPGLGDDNQLDEREKRRLRRDQKRAEKEKVDNPITNARNPESSGDIIYVAYHDWEHFSSIRNLKGPHVGFPQVSELPADSIPIPRILIPKKPMPKTKLKAANKHLLIRHPPESRASSLLSVAAAPPTPSQIPLPGSRSPSPIPSSEQADSLPLPPFPPSSAPSAPTSRGASNSAVSIPAITLRIHRSPKRSFDESSCSSASESQAKRSRSARRSLPINPTMDVDIAEPDLDTPGLSAPGSSAESSTSSSEASSPPLETPLPAPRLAPPERPLTRRQRKMLGLPKPRAALVGNTAVRTGRGAGSGRIVIPGGRYKKGVAGRVKDEDGDGDDDDDDEGARSEEWRINGTGRVDVRGFRELKI